MKVYVVEDSEVFRERLTALLADLEGIEVVGQAAGEDEAIAAITVLRPELVLLDLQLCDGHGMQVLRAAKALPNIRVAVVTNYSESPYRTACQEAGSDYFFDKAMAFDELIDLFLLLLAAERRQ